MLGLASLLLYLRERLNRAGRVSGSEIQREVLGISRWIDRSLGEDRADLRAWLGDGVDGVARPLLLRYLDGLGLELLRDFCRDQAQINLYIETTAVAPALLAASVLGIRGESTDPLLRASGRALGIAGIIDRVPVDLVRGRLYVPLDRLTAVGIDAGEMFRSGDFLPCLPLLMGMAREARAGLDALCALAEIVEKEDVRNWVDCVYEERKAVLDAVLGRPESILLARTSPIRQSRWRWILKAFQ